MYSKPTSPAHRVRGRGELPARPARRMLVPLLAGGLATFGLFLPGCTDDAEILTPEAPVGAVVTASATQEIQSLIAESNAAWANMDAAGYASFFAEDVEVIAPIGLAISGRTAVQAQHVFLFNGPFNGSTRTSVINKITPLTGSLMFVDVTVDLTGFAFLPPNGLRETAPGLVRTVDRLIVRHVQGEWEIVGQQMTLVPPAP
jgi:uncharacterized protein (TIGR02246 family)